MALNKTAYDCFAGLLHRELVCALGCTEPIALAFCASVAAATLGRPVERVHVACSGNIIKNVKSVSVPNAEGMKGVEAAAVLGILGGDPDLTLEVLRPVSHEHVVRARDLIDQGFCSVELAEGVPCLYIKTTVEGQGHVAEAVISEKHTRLAGLTLDGQPVRDGRFAVAEAGDARQDGAGDGRQDEGDGQDECSRLLTMADICAFADQVDLDDVRDVLDRQVACNSAIAEEGIAGHWGSEIGRTILAMYPSDTLTRMRAYTAAGSDARMGGCSLPVVINSGSGNQGMTCSIPVIVYARAMHIDHDRLLRALCISNLTALHLKHYIGSLSAFCGVVCAAAGAGAAVTYLAGGTERQIGSTVVNTIANVGGIVCDGAKASCAAKIASSLDAAMLGHKMAMLQEDFLAGDGLVQPDVEDSIRSMGYVGRVGMQHTDVEILNIMIGKTKPEDMGE